MIVFTFGKQHACRSNTSGSSLAVCPHPIRQPVSFASMACPSVWHPRKFGYYILMDRGHMRIVEFYVDAYLEIQNKIPRDPTLPTSDLVAASRTGGSLKVRIQNCKRVCTQQLESHEFGVKENCLRFDDDEVNLQSSTASTWAESSSSEPMPRRPALYDRSIFELQW